MHTNDARSVVVGIDGTGGSDGALRYGVEQARAQGCGLTLVHVGPRYDADVTPILPYVPQQVDGAGLAILAEAEDLVNQLAPQVKCATDLRHGSRISALLEAAAGGRSLVLGREVDRGAQRLLFGATTAAVVARACVPTAVITGTWQAARTPRRVVVGLRTAEHCDELFAAAFGQASAQAAGLEVVHAWKIPDPYIASVHDRYHANKWVTAGTEMVERVLTSWRDRYPDVPVTVRVVHAEPARALLAAAEGAEMLVLLRRPVPELWGAHLGKTARAVIGAAPCPVHVLPCPPRENAVLDLDRGRSSALLG
ncbi:MAG: universal stress protein [Ornithinimicrobium sp.]